MLPLGTERLVVRPFTSADAADAFAVYGDPGVLRWWTDPPFFDRRQAAEWAARQGRLHEERGYAQWHVRERDGAFAGCAGLQPLDTGEVEIVCALRPAVWGRGLATEAARAVLDQGFALGLGAVVAIAREGNTASRRVLEKAGLRPVGPASYLGSVWSKYEVRRGEWTPLGHPPLLSARLQLRRPRDGDLTGLHRVFGDPRVMRFVGAARLPLSRGELVASQGRVREHWAQTGFGPLGVVERTSGRVIGEAGLQQLEGGPEVELTYTLARDAWGRGYATEAGRAVLAWAFGPLALSAVVAVAYPQNHASLHVLHKLGFSEDGRQRCYGAYLARFVLRREQAETAGLLCRSGPLAPDDQPVSSRL
jgi:RimJ/RimL family protein N-acetyltransferase